MSGDLRWPVEGTELGVDFLQEKSLDMGGAR